MGAEGGVRVEDDDSSLTQMCIFELLIPLPEETEDTKIEIVLQVGSGVQDGKKRIYESWSMNPDINHFSKMLKMEYGTGGRSHICDGIYHELHDNNGIYFKWKNSSGEEIETNIGWNKAASVISDLINRGVYAVA
jgi:hypothetical protein